MMAPMKNRLILSSLLTLLLPAHGADLVFAVSTGSAMPMTEFKKEQLTGGLLKDFGDALAAELNMTPRYLILPRKRVEAALHAGQADLLCDLRPEWLDSVGWQWTGTVFSNVMIVASRSDTRPIARLSDMAGQRVGTVLGYRYPEVERRMGARFQRDDAASDELNTGKLLNGRFNYMKSNAIYYDYQRKVHPGGGRLNPAVFPIRPFDTYCALPPQGRLKLAEVDQAIAALRKRGAMQQILARYRPPRPLP